MAELIREDAERAAAEADEERARRERPPTFHEVMGEWLEWLEQVRGARQSTLRGYRSMLAEPGTSRRRGKGATRGLILAEFGDRPIAQITTTDISKFLRSLDAVFTSPCTVNTHRQVLSAIFNYARREDTYRLPVNPVSPTDKRRELPAVALDFFEPEEIEALPQSAADGAHRKEAVGRGGKLMDLGPEELAARAEEDAQDAELIRVLAYTGLRLGEALALQWGDVDFKGRRLIVQRAVSGNVEGPTKGWQVRYVPLADPARDALRAAPRARRLHAARGLRLLRPPRRPPGRLSAASPLSRRPQGRRPAALKLHGLRHGAGSLVARHTDAVFVQHFLGHAKLATTERYMHAKARAEDIDKLNLAFGVAPNVESES